MENYNIRKAKIEDTQGVATAHVKAWQYNYRGQMPDNFLDKLSVKKRAEKWKEIFSNPKTNQNTFIAESNSKILGFCNVGPSRDDSAPNNVGELYGIYLDPRIQGQGIGSALMETGLNFLRELGFTKATLWVLKTNNSAISFYKAKGWKSDGQEKKDKMDDFNIEEVRYYINL
jgi:ribosomal protein S18 acetylase RimI-like enzyme